MIAKETVMDALKNVMDPELGLNIVDLGLVYGVDVDRDTVEVTMTLTTPGCPLHTAIARGAQTAVRNLPGVEQATVNVVWDPPWTPERMSPEARARLRWG
jgi:metal-sulfur cluster biosynthetic enzyme